jgi:hypothetical protein
LKGAKLIEEHTREAKRLMKKGGEDFIKLYETKNNCTDDDEE